LRAPESVASEKPMPSGLMVSISGRARVLEEELPAISACRRPERAASTTPLLVSPLPSCCCLPYEVLSLQRLRRLSGYVEPTSVFTPPRPSSPQQARVPEPEILPWASASYRVSPRVRAGLSSSTFLGLIPYSAIISVSCLRGFLPPSHPPPGFCNLTTSIVHADLQVCSNLLALRGLDLQSVTTS
jgi:hypothetical protein